MWRRARDRFDRVVDRYHETVRLIEYRQVRLELEESGAALDAARSCVHVICDRAERQARQPAPPGTTAPTGHGPTGHGPTGQGPTGRGSTDDPADTGTHGRHVDVHHRISRAATLGAHACEAAMQARVCARSQDVDGVREAADTVRRTVKQLLELVDEALQQPGHPSP